MDFVAGPILIYKGTHVAMIHRRDNNKWVIPGGKPDPRELPTFTALRELKEETGIDLLSRGYSHVDMIPCWFATPSLGQPSKPTLVLYYLVVVDEMFPIHNIEPSKHHDARWIDFKELSRYECGQRDLVALRNARSLYKGR